MKRVAFLAFIIVLSALSPAAAEYFSSSTYVGAVLAVSYELETASDSYVNARNNYWSALADAYMPAVILDVSDTPYSPANSPLWNAKDSGYFNVSASLNLFKSFGDKFAIDQALLSRDMAGSLLDARRQDTALAAVGVYYEMLRKSKLLEVMAADRKTREEQFERTKRYYQEGLRSYTDLLQSEINFRTGQINEITAADTFRTAKMIFNELLLREPLSDFSVDYSTSEPDFALPAVDDGVRSALLARPEIARARLQFDSAAVGIKQAIRNSLPILSVDTAWNRQGIGSFGSVSGVNPDYSLSASISYPIGPATVSNRNAVIAARFTKDESKKALDKLVVAVKKEVITAYYDLSTAVQNFQVARLKADVSSENLKIVETKYGQGRSSSVELTQSQQDRLSAWTELTNSYYNLLINNARYRRAIGERLW